MRQREPNFESLLKVLRREKPARPTLFEFFLNHRLFRRVTGREEKAEWGTADYWRWALEAYRRIGYDYVTVTGSRFAFPKSDRHQESSVSLNEAPMITDRRSFDAYPWPDPSAFPSVLDALAADLPRGMKLIVWGPCGVLENVIALTGFDNLCLLLMDDPSLVQDIFDAVGSRLVKYYQMHASHPAVGACVSNDDWGFKTQTMLSTEDMRRYVFPWHKRIVEAIHRDGKPVILHSCGNLTAVFDDIINEMKYDGKHSYEDAIVSVEEAYRRWGNRIAIIGGVDVDFLCRSTEEQIRQRSRALLELTAQGGYALGSGNSIPEYVPDDNYFAMINPALEN